MKGKTLERAWWQSAPYLCWGLCRKNVDRVLRGTSKGEHHLWPLRQTRTVQHDSPQKHFRVKTSDPFSSLHSASVNLCCSPVEEENCLEKCLEGISVKDIQAIPAFLRMLKCFQKVEISRSWIYPSSHLCRSDLNRPSLLFSLRLSLAYLTLLLTPSAELWMLIPPLLPKSLKHTHTHTQEEEAEKRERRGEKLRYWGWVEERGQSGHSREVIFSPTSSLLLLLFSDHPPPFPLSLCASLSNPATRSRRAHQHPSDKLDIICLSLSTVHHHNEIKWERIQRNRWMIVCRWNNWNGHLCFGVGNPL